MVTETGMKSVSAANPQKASRLGERMLALGMITADQLEIALIEQRKQQLPLGQQLVRLQFVTEALVRDVLAQQHATESVALAQAVIDPALLACLPEALAREWRLLPLEIDAASGHLRVAMTDVLNVVAMDQLRRLLQSQPTFQHQRLHIQPLLATESELEQALDRCYGHVLSLDALLVEIETASQSANSGLAANGQSSKPVIRLVDAILLDAVKQAASDIHFEPEAGFMRIRYRIDGVLWQVRSLHHRYWPAVCVRLKLMAGMDIAEQRMAQDGRIQLHVNGRAIDFRASSQPTLHGENLVLRVLDRQKAILPLASMGLPPAQLQRLQALLTRPEGMVIVTGPTGSGKTTTLYSMLHQLNRPEVNIMTLEDPVEYPVALMRQTSVYEANKVDFAQGIRAILRQDPDIILIGEVRDEASAAMAFRAAMTGHLVMTTMHTNSAPGVFARIDELAVRPSTVAGNLIAVIAQRLLRQLCPHCKVRVEALPEAPDWIQQAIHSHSVYRAQGCVHCRMTGYHGRRAVIELLEMQPALEPLLLRATTVQQWQDAASAYGYTSLAQAGWQMVLAGETSLDELQRTVHLSEAMVALA